MSPGSLSPRRARALLDAASGCRVVVVGDAMLDRYITGAVDRISPEAPVPVVRVEHERSAVGGAGNVAANAAALGAACALVGVVGRDDAGAVLMGALEELGVDTGGMVVCEGRPTTVKTRVLARRQQVVRFDHEVEAPLPGGAAAAVAAAVESAAAEADALVVEDYDKGVLAPVVVEAARRAAVDRGIPWVVDPKRRSFFAYGGATVLKPNARELADALGTLIEPRDPAWMESTRARLGCGALILTLGEHGMALADREAGYGLLPAGAREVYDVSGAGDTVTAVLAVALAAGATVQEAAILANHAAAVEVGKAGVAVVTPDEIVAHLESHPRNSPPEAGDTRP